MRAIAAACKRTLDLAGALIALVVFSPIILGVALVIRLRMGSPVLFRQPRAGLHERQFTLFKFRTMAEAPSTVVDPSTDAVRLTGLGSTLRRFSLDELPQLWNVLKGEMSLVGPRPLLMEYLPLYSPEQAKRHRMKPGITGLTQVKGRNALTWEEKFQWDVWYIEHWSLWLDLRILLATVVKVFKQEEVNQQGQATVQKFGAERR